MVVFAGTAHLHLPLTTDYSAARLFLQTISSDLISTQGTDLSAAIRLALENIEKCTYSTSIKIVANQIGARI